MANIQQRLFDSRPIDHFRASIGTVDIEEEDIEHFRADSVVVLLVTVSDDGASIKKTKDGGYVRTEALKPSSMRVVQGELREELIEFFNLADVDPQLAMAAVKPSTRVVPNQVSPAAPAPSTTSGSIPVVDDESVDDDPLDYDGNNDYPVDDDEDYVVSGEIPPPIAIPEVRDPELAAFLAGQ